VKTVQQAVGTAADGDFGPATQKALRTWQKAHHVTVSGVVDAATWAALPAKVSARACGQRVGGSGVTASCPTLASGSTGLPVAVLQARLGVDPDGQFGPATTKALKAVQRAAGLTVSGSTDVRTWKHVKRWGTPACSTKHSTGPQQPRDAKAQAKVRAHVQELVAALEQKPGTTKNPVALQAMAFAKKQIGKPYIYGGTGPKGYDCSGLQMTSYLHAGLTIPRVAADQYAGAGTPVALDHARQGDLLFFASDVTKPTTTYHVAMYVGDGKMLDSPHTGANVEIVPLWSSDLLPVAVRPAAALELPMKRGDKGWSVTQLQQALNRHGAAVTVDGGYGPATAKAVRSWQAAHSLNANGVVRMKTWLTFG
jgi:cell wall-associated NlpC family hydrolase